MDLFFYGLGVGSQGQWGWKGVRRERRRGRGMLPGKRPGWGGPASAPASETEQRRTQAVPASNLGSVPKGVSRGKQGGEH